MLTEECFRLMRPGGLRFHEKLRSFRTKFALISLLPLLLLAADKNKPEKDFTALFNGKDLTGWQLVHGSGPGYLVKDGIIVCPVDGGGNLFTGREYANFVLRFEFRLQKGSNNGIGIRAPLEGDAAYKGMEIQVLDHDAPVYHGKLQPAQYHGSIYNVVPAKIGFLKRTGQWNAEEITADGRHIQVKLNGHLILDADLDQVQDPEILKRHPGLQRTTGHIGFLGHHSPVEFRHVRVKELP